MSKNSALILTIVLIVVFSYWLGGYSARHTTPPAAPTPVAPAKPPAAPAPVAPPPAARKGMTWGVNAEIETPDGIVLVGCHGEPATDDGSCNAYRGDTSCATPLPLLCLKVDDTPTPAGLRTPAVDGALPDDFYAGWAGGSVATTAPMPGTELKSRDIGNRVCAAAFGDAWRLAEFHDGGRDKEALRMTVTDPGGAQRSVEATGGWAFYAAGDPIRTSRFWVAIDDQAANCWD